MTVNFFKEWIGYGICATIDETGTSKHTNKTTDKKQRWIELNFNSICEESNLHLSTRSTGNVLLKTQTRELETAFKINCRSAIQPKKSFMKCINVNRQPCCLLSQCIVLRTVRCFMRRSWIFVEVVIDYLMYMIKFNSCWRWIITEIKPTAHTKEIPFLSAHKNVLIREELCKRSV